MKPCAGSETNQAHKLMKIQVQQHSNAEDYRLHLARSGSGIFSPQRFPIEKERFYDPMVLFSVPPSPAGEVSLNIQQHCPHVSSQKTPAKSTLETAGKCLVLAIKYFHSSSPCDISNYNLFGQPAYIYLLHI